MPEFTLTIHDKHHAAMYEQCIGTSTAVPIKSAEPARDPEDGRLTYQLDLERLTPEQYERLIDFFCGKLRASRHYVEANIRGLGFPITATNTTVNEAVAAE